MHPCKWANKAKKMSTIVGVAKHLKTVVVVEDWL
jgi:hypothetical protein